MIETSMQRRSLLAAAMMIPALGAASGAAADARLVELGLVDRETGRRLPSWTYRGRLFVAGDPGSRYGLRLGNRTGGRVLVVLSVDGLNVLTGETAGYGQRGYVLDAFETCDINGWRKSNSEVAGFTFAALSQSYAARTGRPGDVGVIGMAVFRERAVEPPLLVEPAPWPETTRGRYDRGASREAPAPLPIPPVAAPSLAAPAPAARAQARSPAADASAGAFAPERRSERLGTGHGAREWSVVSTTAFERATAYPQDVRRIEYDTYANLAARGVIPVLPRPQQHGPRPFPLEPGRGGFVPDPPGGA